MKKYRKKPVVIDAIQWDGTKAALDMLVWHFKLDANESITQKGTLYIRTLEGLMLADVGDYIIRGVKGELYPCKPDIFAMTYEEVSDPTV